MAKTTAADNRTKKTLLKALKASRDGTIRTPGFGVLRQRIGVVQVTTRAMTEVVRALEDEGVISVSRIEGTNLTQITLTDC